MKKLDIQCTKEETENAILSTTEHDALCQDFVSTRINVSPDVESKINAHINSKAECVSDLMPQELANENLLGVLNNYQLLDQNQKFSMGVLDTRVSSKETVEEYIKKTDWRIKANANGGFSNASLINQTAGKIIANYWLDNVYSEEAGICHRRGDLHIHDLDSLTGYCAGWSLRVLLNEGFNGVPGRVSSRPPRYLNEALGQMANFLGVLQSEWAGAQSFSSFDTYLAPYVFKDNVTLPELKKAIRRFVYNLNVPSRWGQTPFTNVTLDFSVPKDLSDQMPTSNNKHLFNGIDLDEGLMARLSARGVKSPEELRYKHFQEEVELIDRAFYEVMTEGDSDKQPFTFPLPTVNITEDFKWNTEAAKALFDNTATVGSSYFQNFVGSQYIKDDDGEKIPNPEAYAPGAVRSMCCRLQLDLRELLKRGNGLFGSAEMTGSIGVVTINMARLGHRFKGDRPGLYKELERLMDICKCLLEKKRAFISEMYDNGLYPYTARYLRGFNNHFSTIGVNGMNEMLINFSDNLYNIVDDEGIECCAEILEFMRNKIREYQEQTGNIYNIEATPAEGTTYRFAKEDKKRFPSIAQAGSGDNIYYTNSSQPPVGISSDPFFVLDKQDKLQCKYNGGTVLHLYMNEKISSGEACKRLVKTVIENYKLPNITVTPIFSICSTHGYIPGEKNKCPHCGAKTLVWTRVMGYYRPVETFNLGKIGEHVDRVYFSERHCNDV